MSNSGKTLRSEEIVMLYEKLSLPHQFLVLESINLLLYGESCREEERKKKMFRAQALPDAKQGKENTE